MMPLFLTKGSAERFLVDRIVSDERKINVADTINGKQHCSDNQQKDLKLSRNLTLNESNLHLNETQLLAIFPRLEIAWFGWKSFDAKWYVSSERERGFDEIAIHSCVGLIVHIALHRSGSRANFNRFQCIIKQQIHVHLRCSPRCLHFSAAVPIFSLIKFQVNC